MNSSGSPFSSLDDVWQMASTDSDAVLLTYVRISRNAENFRFPSTEDSATLMELVDIARQAAYDNGLFADYWHDSGVEFCLGDLNYTERRFLEEGFQLPYQLTVRAEPHHVLFSSGDGCESIVVNGRDHFVFSSVLPGCQPFLALGRALKLEHEFSTRIITKYAYDEELGYLTTRPEDAGTGLRIGVLVHLPGYLSTHRTSVFKDMAKRYNVTLKEYRWPGSNVYVIENASAMGKSEEQIVMSMHRYIEHLLMQERAGRETLWESENALMSDQICRSLALLGSARLIDWQECAMHLFALRLGISKGIIKNLDHRLLNYLAIRVFPCHIALDAGMEFPHKNESAAVKHKMMTEIDSCRARLCRKLRKIWRIDLPPSWE